MKQAVYHRFDFEHPTDVYMVEEAKRPSDPGPEEVLVRIKYAPVHPCDILCAMGVVNGVQLPSVGGTEGAGVVKAVGTNLLDRFQPGLRVHVAANYVFGKWDRWQGTWRDYMLCPANALIPVPDGVPDEVAAQFLVNPLTAFAMVKTFDLKPGKILIQTAAASVLGRIMIELSSIYGFELINIVRRPESAEKLKDEYGAEHVYVYDATPETGEQVKTAIRRDFHKRRINYCIEAVGGDTARLCLDVLGPDGEFYMYGALSGETMLTINTTADLAMNNNTLRGWSSQETWLRQTPDDVKQACVDELWSLLVDGRLKIPETDEVFSLDQVSEALVASIRPGREGKVLLRLNQD